MSKRGLSFDEKRARLKQLFLETKGVFTAKELIKIASKEKGIVAQTVEEVLKSLVDDGEVMTDKIGTSNYFWLFPSQQLVLARNKLTAIKKELEAQQERLEQLTKQHQELLNTRPESPERTKLLAELEELQKLHSKLSDELAQWAENDPALITALENDAKKAKESANRWTDNIFQVRKFCETKFGMASTDFDQNFDIPSEMDYV